jgi:hypothetical protein
MFNKSEREKNLPARTTFMKKKNEEIFILVVDSANSVKIKYVFCKNESSGLGKTGC